MAVEMDALQHRALAAETERDELASRVTTERSANEQLLAQRDGLMQQLSSRPTSSPGSPTASPGDASPTAQS